MQDEQQTATAGTIVKVGTDPQAAAKTAATNGVVQVTPGVEGPAGLIAFLRAIGPLIFTEGETPVPNHPDLNLVTNAGRTTKPKSVFHSDTSYIERPPAYSALIAIDVPDAGGATLFTDQYAALDALEPGVRSELIGARVRHGPTDVPETEAVWHPLIRRNPQTGRDALFLTSLARCTRLELRNGKDRSDLIGMLYEHSINFQTPKRHVWAKGDVVLWDNRCTLHAADHSAVVGTRTLYRGLVQGERPFAAVDAA